MGFIFSKPTNQIGDNTDCQSRPSDGNGVEVAPDSAPNEFFTAPDSAPTEFITATKDHSSQVAHASLALNLSQHSSTTNGRTECSSATRDSHRPASASVTTEVFTYRSEENRRPQTSLPSARNSKIEKPTVDQQPTSREAWGDGEEMVGVLESPDTPRLETSSDVSSPKSPKKERLKKKLEKEKIKRASAEKRYADSIEHIKALERDLALRKEEIDALNNKLSAEMSHKVSSDERSLENINVEARPMKLADEYRTICSEEWLEAGEALEIMDVENKYDEDERYKILCSVIEITEAKCKEVQAMILSMIDQAVTNPLLVFKECFDEKDMTDNPKAPRLRKFEYPSKEAPVTLPESLTKTLLSLQRLHVGHMEFQYLIKSVEKAVAKRYKFWRKDEALKAYTSSLAKFCWKMILQQPPMTFDVSYKGQRWADAAKSKLEPHFGSEIKNPDAVVEYYVFPTLKHGDMVMIPGKVMVK